MLIINQKSLLSFVTVLLFTGVVFLTQPVAAEFEISTQFGYSHIVPEEKNTSYEVMNSLQLPSGTVFAASSPTALALTWFGGERLGLGLDGAFTRMSITEDHRWWGRRKAVDFTLFESGLYVDYYLLSHEASSPYMRGRFSLGVTDADASDVNANAFFGSFGVSVGYQYRWPFADTIVVRLEGSYRAVIVTYNDADEGELNNQFSILLSLGTRFGY